MTANTTRLTEHSGPSARGAVHLSLFSNTWTSYTLAFRGPFRTPFEAHCCVRAYWHVPFSSRSMANSLAESLNEGVSLADFSTDTPNAAPKRRVSAAMEIRRLHRSIVSIDGCRCDGYESVNARAVVLEDTGHESSVCRLSQSETTATTSECVADRCLSCVTSTHFQTACMYRLAPWVTLSLSLCRPHHIGGKTLSSRFPLKSFAFNITRKGRKCSTVLPSSLRKQYERVNYSTQGTPRSTLLCMLYTHQRFMSIFKHLRTRNTWTCM